MILLFSSNNVLTVIAGDSSFFGPKIRQNQPPKSGTIHIWQMILTKDTAFHDCVHTYKQVATNYLETKPELWYALLLYHIFGMDKLLQNIVLSQFWGDIHFHLIGYLGNVPVTNSPKTKVIVSACVYDLSDSVNYAATDLDHFINISYTTSDKFKDNTMANVVKIHECGGIILLCGPLRLREV